jgi:hypothetical protein
MVQIGSITVRYVIQGQFYSLMERLVCYHVRITTGRTLLIRNVKIAIHNEIYAMGLTTMNARSVQVEIIYKSLRMIQHERQHATPIFTTLIALLVNAINAIYGVSGVLDLVIPSAQSVTQGIVSSLVLRPVQCRAPRTTSQILLPFNAKLAIRFESIVPESPNLNVVIAS